MSVKIRQIHQLGLDSQLIKFVRLLGNRTPYFCAAVVQRLNGIDNQQARRVVERGMALGVMARREGQPGFYEMVARDVPHTSKR